MADEGIDDVALDIETIEQRNELRKEGAGHSPTCVGWTAHPSGAFVRESCSCAVGFIESDVDRLLAEVRRLRRGTDSESS